VVCSGACTNLSFDPANCGACGNACATNFACVAGSCRQLLRPAPGAYAIPFAAQPTTGTAVSLSDDTTTGLINLGFTFRFFQNSYTQVNISSNGFIGFDSAMAQGCCTGRAIPEADGLDNIIAGAWTDLYPPGGGSITYETRGTAPNRRFVVSYSTMPWCCSGPAQVTTQIILYEGTDRIEVMTATQNAGHTYTQGVENAGGTIAYSRPGRSAADYGLTNDGVEFYTN
jgi:hypothetical protein